MEENDQLLPKSDPYARILAEQFAREYVRAVAAGVCFFLIGLAELIAAIVTHTKEEAVVVKVDANDLKESERAPLADKLKNLKGSAVLSLSRDEDCIVANWLVATMAKSLSPKRATWFTVTHRRAVHTLEYCDRILKLTKLDVQTRTTERIQWKGNDSGCSGGEIHVAAMSSGYRGFSGEFYILDDVGLMPAGTVLNVVLPLLGTPGATCIALDYM